MVDEIAAELAAQVSGTFGSPPKVIGARLSKMRLTHKAAVGNGLEDDTEALQGALTDAAGGVLILPRGTYRVRSSLVIKSPLIVVGSGASIIFDFPTSTSTAAGMLFLVTSSSVTLEGLTIEASDQGIVDVDNNRYAIMARPRGLSRLSDIVVRNCRFIHLMQHGGTRPATRTATHGIYARQVDRISIEDNQFEEVSGAPVFLIDTFGARVSRNVFRAFGWSGVWLNNGNRVWEISDNNFSGTTETKPSYWGGAIDIMGQTADAVPPGRPDTRGLIARNRFMGGVYRYNHVVRLSSSHNVDVVENIFDRCDADSESTPGSGAKLGVHNNLIVLTVRDSTLSNGPHKNIRIAKNSFVAFGAGFQKAIYVITTSGSRRNTTSCENLVVESNEFLSPNPKSYFGACVYLHGFDAGYSKVTIAKNAMTGGPGEFINSYVPTGGLVVVRTNPGRKVSQLSIVGNHFQAARSGSSDNHAGISIQADVECSAIQNNSLKGFFRGILLDSKNREDCSFPANNSFEIPPGGAGILWRGKQFFPHG